MIKKNHLITLLAIPMMAGYAFLVSAAAPSGGYTPGATLDPDCAPGDADCVVTASGSVDTGWELDPTGGPFGAGSINTTIAGIPFVGIGTDDPLNLLDIRGDFDAGLGINLTNMHDGPGSAAQIQFSNSLGLVGGIGVYSDQLANAKFAGSLAITAATPLSGIRIWDIDQGDGAGNIIFGIAGSMKAKIDESGLLVGDDETELADHCAGVFCVSLSNSDSNLVAFTSGDTSSYTGISGQPESKYLFSPDNLRMGSVNDDSWNSPNVGQNSIGIGFAGAINGLVVFNQAVIVSSPRVEGDYAVALGSESSAEGTGSFAVGPYSSGVGAFSNAIGVGTQAFSLGETALGTLTTTYAPVSGTSWESGDRLFTIGNGSEFGSESDAFTILKSGLTGIGIDNFETTTDDELFQVGGSILSTNGDWNMGNTDNYGGLAVDGSGSWYSPTVNEMLYNGVQDLTGFGLPEINTGYGYVNFATGVAVSSSAISTGFFSNYTDQANDIKAEVSAQQNDISLYFGNINSSAFSGFVVDGGGFRFVTEGGQIAQIQKNGDFTLNAYQNCTGFTSTAGGLLQCTASDARLKNIQGDFTSGLDALRILSPQLYTWKDGEYYMSGEYAGFIAQNVEEALPIAVTTDRNGYLNIQDRPILAAAVNAIKELDLSIQDIENLSAEDSTFGGMMREWFANTANGINDFVATTIRGKTVETSKLCVDDICVTRDQFLNIVNQSNQIPYAPEPGPINTPAQEPENEISPVEESVITPGPVPEEVAMEPEPIVTEEQAPVETPSETVSE